MKKYILVILILIGHISCKEHGTQVTGIWMSYYDRVINQDKYHLSGGEGIIIDFDNSELGYIMTDSVFKIDIDYEKMQIIHMSDTSRVFKIFKNDSIEWEISKNTMAVFRPLKLNHRLPISKDKIVEFLTNNCFDKIHTNIKIEFTSEEYPFAKRQNIRKLNSTFSNRQSFGYWGVWEAKQNYFLFFNTESINDQNIYQIISLEEDKIVLEPLQEIEFKITELKTCIQ